MNGEKADMAHNDPPYGMKKEKEGVLNDNLNYSDLLDFNKEWIPLQFKHLKEKSHGNRSSLFYASKLAAISIGVGL